MDDYALFTKSNMSPGMCLNDNEFGPSVVGCRGDFDFTQKFERIVLSIIPNSVYIALVLTRLVVLAQRPKIVAGEFLKLSKLVCSSTLLCGFP